MSKNYFYAIATLIGTIIGAGIFSLPFVVNKSGLLPFYALIIILALIQYYLHKMYAEVVLATKSEHQVPGYVAVYAGRKYKKAATVFSLLGSYGSILAYIIIGGIFLHSLLSPFFGGSEFVYSFSLFAIGSLIVFFGIKTVASVELFMTAFLVLIVIFITGKSFDFINLDNFTAIDWRYAMLPYGLVFFSVGGQTAIPTVCRLMEKNKKSIKSAIFWGTMLPALITAVFVTVVVGVTGDRTTPDTLAGLDNVFSSHVVVLALIFGFLSIITSFLTVVQAAKETFLLDFKMNEKLSWALACLPPFVLFLFGVNSLTAVVGVTGAITGGVIGMIIIYLSLRVQKKPEQTSPIKTGMNIFAAVLLSSLFVIGMILGLLELF